MFSTNSSKICCSFAKNIIFEISKIDGSQDGGHVVKRLLPWQQFFFKAHPKLLVYQKLALLSAAVWKIYGESK